MRRGRLLLARLVPLAGLVGVSTALAMGSTLWRLLPSPPPWWAVLLGVALLYTPALLTRSSPLPAALAVLVPILALASYAQSRLDWLRLLKDFGLTQTDAGPSVGRMALSMTALLLAWALHSVDHALRLRKRALDRGLDPREADAAARLVGRVGATRALTALAGTLVLSVVAAVAWLAQADRLLAGRATLVAPLIAALLVGGAAFVLARQDREPLASADERE